MRKNIRWPIQSLLFIPANRDDFISKASRYEPDAVILDLEDALPKSQLSAARLRIKEQIQLLYKHALHHLKQFGIEDYKLEQIKDMIKLKHIPLSDIQKVCDKLKINIETKNLKVFFEYFNYSEIQNTV